MAKQVQKANIKQVKKGSKTSKQKPWVFPYNRQNFIILAIGVAVIILGYILMATGITEEPAVPAGKWNNFFAVSIAPILLIIGYCIILPYGLLKFFGKKSETESK